MGEVIQILGNNGSTGVLRIKSKYAQKPGQIYFSNGDPVDADDGKSKGLDALFALFGWVDADFDFRQESVERQNVINKNRMEIILDGSRLVDDGKIEKLGPVSFKKRKAAEKSVEKVLPVIKGPLVDYMYVVDEEEYRDGDEIVIEGNYGNWMWVILEGSIEISKQAGERQIKLLRLSHGAFLGSVASFLADGSVRNTTAIAKGRVQLGMLDSQRLASDYASMTKEMRLVVSSLDKRLKEATGNIIRILENGNKLAGVLNGRKPVIDQGKNEERLFCINNGSVTIARKVKEVYIPLLSLEKGDFFGNLPFVKVGHEPYGAAVFATKDLKISPLDKTSLDQEYQKLPSILKNIVENTATRLSVISLVACEYFKNMHKKSARQAAKDEPSTPKE